MAIFWTDPTIRHWLDTAKERGHELKTSEDFDGDVDIFVTDFEFHMGPSCTKCNLSVCMICMPPHLIPICEGAKN